MGFFRTHKTFFVSIAFIVAFSITVSYATPPSSPYTAGSTLDPACAPGSSNCTVATGGSGATVWGSITGTISSQADLATALSGKEVPLTFSTGLTRTVNSIAVNPSQNISTLSNLTSNGLIRTSGGTGALSIATAGTDYTTPAGAESLTNKTISGASNTLSNIGNAALTNSGLTLASGVSGSDVNWGTSTVSLGGTATLNIPDAGASSRGLLTTGTQTLAGAKTFTGGIVVSAGGLSSSGTITLSGFTTNGGLLYSNGAGVLFQTGAGTSTGVLHGGTTPGYGAVVLTSDVSGILPVANGGTGSATAPYVTDATNGTLTRSGTGPYTLGLNLGNANTWTGQQTFGTSAPIFSTTTLGSVYFAGTGGVLSQDNGSLFYNATNHQLGLGTAVPTHTITLASASTGIAAYNTVDQITNFERVRESWVSNVYTFTSENGGTGTLRNFNFAGGNVGIGTTNAAQLLTVGGNVQVNGAFYDGAQAAGTSGQVLTSTGTATAWKTANPTSNGTIVLGDSIGAGTGATPSTNGFAYLLRQQVGGPYFNYSKSGDEAADMSIHWLMPDTNPQGGGVDPVMIQEIGTNDVTRYGATTNLQNVFNRIIMNNLSWAAIPQANKKFGQACTLSGFANDGTLLNGLGVTSTTSGNTATCSVTTLASSAIYIGYLIKDGDTGTFTVSVDGTLQNDPYNGTTTWNAAGDGASAISTTNGTTTAVAGARLPVSSAGSHTVVVSNTSSGQTVTLYWVGAPPASSTNNPYVIAVSPNHQNNANDSLSGTYAGFVSTIVTRLANDGLNAQYADTRTALGTSYGTYYSDTLHPNNAGHALMNTTVKALIPTGLVVGTTLPNNNQVLQNFITTAPINPSQFTNVNALNLTSATTWNPGVLFASANGNNNWINYQQNTGLTFGFPNSGGVAAASFCSYTPNGAAPVAPPAMTSCYMTMQSNGLVTFFPNSTSASATTTMSVQNNSVTVGGSAGVGNAFTDLFANSYVSTTNVATSGANQNSGTMWWRSAAWNGAATIADDIGFVNKPASGSNPITMLTLNHQNGTTGTWGIDLSLSTAGTKLGTTTEVGQFTMSGNRSATAWGNAGINFQAANATYNDSSSATGTVATNMINTFGIPTLTATNTGVTYTNAATVYIAGAPVASTNVTNTNTYSLYVATGISQFGTASVLTGVPVAVFQNAGGSCTVTPSISAGVSCSSDMNLKKNIALLADNSDWAFNSAIAPTDESILGKVLALSPVIYNWKVEQDADPKHAGFIAQDVQQLFPDLVSTDPTTHMLSLNYAGMMPYTVEAIKEMNINVTSIDDLTKTNTWRDAIIAWFADADNGITSIFSKKITTDQLCVGSVCVTQDQFLQMVQHSGATPSPSDNGGQSSADPAADTPPPADTQTSETQSPEIQTPEVSAPAPDPAPSVEATPEVAAPVIPPADTPSADTQSPQ